MKQSILLVEDDTWLGDLYVAVLKENMPEYSIQVAHNASQAFEKLNTKQSVSLIILDIFLPDFNGIEFLHELRSYSDLFDIPVIVLTGLFVHDFALSARRWKHYGVVQFLHKPTTKPQDLVVAVQRGLMENIA